MECITALGNQYKAPAAVALGFFDGVHMGHRAVLQHELNREGLVPACFSFTFENGKSMLCTEEEQLSLLEQLGIQVLFRPAAKDIFGLTPQQFVTDVLKNTFHAKFVSCGYDFTFGKNKAGDVQTLRQLCAKEGIQVQVVDNVLLDGVSVHSTKIKEYLQEGDCESAKAMLGYAYSFTGRVDHGRKLGRTINFPTVNVVPDPHKLLPKYGVYAAKIEIDGQSFDGVTNVGVKPTVQGTTPLTETHIFDLEGDLYGKTITVSLENFIRPEQKFDSILQLQNQINADVNLAKKLLKK